MGTLLTTTTIKVKKYTYFIGIDVSRNKLDYAVIQGKTLLFHRVADNDPAAILEFITELKTLPKFTLGKTVFCLEQTGIYVNHLLNSLKKLKANIALENARQIKNSLGLIRGKYDKIDAIRIAQFAVKNVDDLRFWKPRRPVMDQLASLFALRNRLLSVQKLLTAPLNEQSSFIKKGLQKQNIGLCKRTGEATKLDIKDTDSALDQIIHSDERLNGLFKNITSVNHVGRVTAIQILICTNEFLDISDPKKFACYSGVVPFKAESGTFKGKAKISKIANRKMKSLLHICAIGAIQKEGELKEYYKRKTQMDRKPKMVVINAIRNKLVLRVFACVNSNRCFEINYLPQGFITKSSGKEMLLNVDA